MNVSVKLYRIYLETKYDWTLHRCVFFVGVCRLNGTKNEQMIYKKKISRASKVRHSYEILLFEPFELSFVTNAREYDFFPFFWCRLLTCLSPHSHHLLSIIRHCTTYWRSQPSFIMEFLFSFHLSFCHSFHSKE